VARTARAALIAEPDPYRVLGIAPSANLTEIERGRRRRAALHHPDTGPAAERAEREAAMKRINAAYELLRDPAARTAYDLRGAPTTSAGAPPRRGRSSTASRARYASAAPPSPQRQRERAPAATAVTRLSRSLVAVATALVGSRAGLYLLLIVAILVAIVITPFPGQIGAALTAATVALLLPLLLLRRLRDTPLADLLALLEAWIRRR